MEPRTIILRGASGRPKGEVVAFPIRFCGWVSYDSRGDARRETCAPECAGCSHHEEAPGGRERDLICLSPEHYGCEVELFFLTRPERADAEAQLGEDASLFLAPASVHGAWKIARHQAVVVVRRQE